MNCCPFCQGPIAQDVEWVEDTLGPVVSVRFGRPYCTRRGCDVVVGARRLARNLCSLLYLGELVFYRANGNMVCSCGKTYSQHPLAGPDGYDGHMFLRRICNGDLVKT